VEPQVRVQMVTLINASSIRTVLVDRPGSKEAIFCSFIRRCVLDTLVSLNRNNDNDIRACSSEFAVVLVLAL
jgi:hypothetical protein